ncbi:MAG: heme A synthase [Sphingomonadales bacterium]|nr:heme A synthase [Sphingomonadales bacterium]
MSQLSDRRSTREVHLTFIRANTLVLVLLGLLILAGGIVRSSGSGMGCPDWPRCFGLWIPPVQENELPVDYQSIYADRGYADTRFNAVKTWTEYLNRLLGALTGLAVLLHMIFALRTFWGKNKSVVVWSFVALLLVVVQAGVGALVVMTHLRHGVVTFHFVLALAVVALVLKARYSAMPLNTKIPAFTGSPSTILPLRWQAWLVLVLMLVQIILGTQVREQVDEWVRLSGTIYLNTSELFRSLGSVYEWHRNFWMVVLMASIYLFYSVDRNLGPGTLRTLALGVLILLGLQVLTGGLLSRLGLPATPRALHILFGSISFSLTMALAFRLEHVFRQMLNSATDRFRSDDLTANRNTTQIHG